MALRSSGDRRPRRPPSRRSALPPPHGSARPDRRPLPGRARTRGAIRVLLAVALSMPSVGCGALLLVGGAGTGAIAFATGELRTTEEASLADVDAACERAFQTLGYDRIDVARQDDRIRWQARTAGGDPVEVRLRARDEDETGIRIRVGVFGDEARSRLVLEEIQQSL